MPLKQLEIKESQHPLTGLFFDLFSSQSLTDVRLTFAFFAGSWIGQRSQDVNQIPEMISHGFWQRNVRSEAVNVDIAEAAFQVVLDDAHRQSEHRLEVFFWRIDDLDEGVIQRRLNLTAQIGIGL